MSEERDGWGKAEVLFSALGAVVMPIVLLVVGSWLTKQQESTAEATRQAERLTSLMQPLASENPRERQLAIEVAGYLADRGQLPLELVPVLVNIVKSDTDSSTAQAASQALARVEQRTPQLRNEIQADFKELAARLYFHIGNESQREAAQRLASQLRAGPDALVIPGIQRIQGPGRSELRFFKKAERTQAEKIAERLRQLRVPVELRDLSGRYETSEQIRPRHFELWLGPEFPQQGA
jgi:hypothetical protein